MSIAFDAKKIIHGDFNHNGIPDYLENDEDAQQAVSKAAFRAVNSKVHALKMSEINFNRTTFFIIGFSAGITLFFTSQLLYQLFNPPAYIDALSGSNMEGMISTIRTCNTSKYDAGTVAGCKAQLHYFLNRLPRN